jgi:hypothetical protein
MHPFFEFVLAIVAISMVYKLVHVWMRQQASRRSADVADVNTDLVRQIAELEDRVQVLERIVTDDRYELKQQFKNLGS